ncbi:AAA family ATPase [Roseiconus lacunae]|uniref:AAA family ATPase n=1 Tax=Roseiconus lacunae TaxID=2605694 RepID=UPI001E47336C|nr:AAA family ATPase [Roseiconus lacunae]MCD0459148.1 ATP-dependent RecD-like DNA helicase [Roseiconus lacunae]
MSKSVEIIGKYSGERMFFENGDGTRVIIGEAQLSKSSRELAIKAGANPRWGITIKGQADDNELERQQTYRFFGTWSKYFNKRFQQHEVQFHFKSFVLHIPHDREGVANYLSVAGKGNGVGPSKARQLVDRFGVDEVLDFCRENPELVADAVNIRIDQAEGIAIKLREQKAIENATLEVNNLLQNRGFPKTLGRRVIKKWGNKAAEIITNDPYSLMQFRGIGFKLTDKFYISLGKDPASIDRQALCLWYGMASDSDGHTWFPATEAVGRLKRSIGRDVDYRSAIIRGREFGQISTDHYGAIASIRTDGEEGPIVDSGKTLWLSEGKNAAAEEFIAESIASALAESNQQSLTRFRRVEHIETVVLQHATCARCHRQLTAPTVHVLEGTPYGPTCIDYVDPAGLHDVYDRDDWLRQNPEVFRWIEEQPDGIIRLPETTLWPDPDSLEIMQDGVNVITDHQREQASRAMAGRIGLLGGSPGTGKTTLVAAIIRAMYGSGKVGLHEIGIGAPTGKAAVRLTESLSNQGLKIRARTWHSLLGVGESDPETGQWSFQFNERNPWPFKVIIGDESSMPDISIVSAIMKARRRGAHMLFVGDVNQLPPVGNGAPFRDMIVASLPYGELREIKRNSGGIVEACAKIRDKQPWTDGCDQSEPKDPFATNLTISHSRNDQSQLDDLLRLIDEETEHHQIDPVWDIQVLCAVNARSKLGRANLNAVLQEKLNPNPAVEGTSFRLGDKVVCLKNGFFKSVLNIDETDEDYTTNDSREVYVANGELGVVESIDDKTLTVKLESPDRLIQIFKSKKQEPSDDDDKKDDAPAGSAWDLGYALSVHKFQGSEQKVVFVMLDTYTGARKVCDRAWVYTAISRAKERCHLIGQPHTADRMCQVQKINLRKTMLAKRIVLEQLNQEIAGL